MDRKREMGEQINLTEENVEELKKKLEDMQQDNPDLMYRFYPQEEDKLEKFPSDKVSMDAVYKKLEEIERKIDLIFDGHVLIDGRFVKFQIITGGKK